MNPGVNSQCVSSVRAVTSPVVIKLISSFLFSPKNKNKTKKHFSVSTAVRFNSRAYLLVVLNSVLFPPGANERGGKKWCGRLFVGLFISRPSHHTTESACRIKLAGLAFVPLVSLEHFFLYVSFCFGVAALLFLTQEQSEMMMTAAQRYIVIMAMKRGHLRAVKVAVSGVEPDTKRYLGPTAERQQQREEVAYIIQ